MSRMFPISCHRRVLGIVAALLISSAAVPAADPVDQRVQDLLARMSIKEKAGQLVHYWRDKDGEPDAIPLAAGFRPPVRGKVSPREYAEFINGLQRQVIDGSPNLIPALIHDECLHGATAYARATSFPQSIALAASFDPDLVGAVASAIAEEERSIGVRMVCAPVLNLSRDPRWGRTEETFGESPRLATDLGVAYVKSFRERNIATALKYYPGRVSESTLLDSAEIFFRARKFHNFWIKPLRAAVREGGALAVMYCYKPVISGLPANPTPLLRQDWGFNGMVISDYMAMQTHETHQLLPPTGPDTGLNDVLSYYRGGIDLALHNNAGLIPRIVTEVRERRFPVAVLDAAAGRMLRTKALLGVLDHPFADPDQAERVMHCAEHQALAKRAAVAGLTLLRNGEKLLPLNPAKIRRLGVAGPRAAQVKLGSYSRGVLPTDVHPLDGLKRRFGTERVVHLTGTLEEMAKAAAGCDALIYCAGMKEVEVVDPAHFGWPGVDTPEMRNQQSASDGTIIGRQQEDPLGNQVAEIRALGATGIPVVLVLVAGSPVGLEPVESSVGAILTTWYGGEAAGTALAEVLAGDAEPGGRLPITWPRLSGKLPLYDLYPRRPDGSIYYPHFPFGFGLGYTTWTLSNLTVEAATVKAGEPIRLSVQVANTGTRAGSQVVQVYVAQPKAFAVWPRQRLEAFRRVDLAAGEQRNITLELGSDHLGWYDHNGVWHLDPGVVELQVGTSAIHLPLTATVTVGPADGGALKKYGDTP